jgi:hypothetical protein
MFIAKNTFRDYKTVDELLALEPPEEEMFPLKLDPCVLNLPLYQREDWEGFDVKAGELAYPPKLLPPVCTLPRELQVDTVTW